MTKKLRIDSRGLVDDKGLNINVVTNSAGHKARRVKLHDGTIVWEVQAPDHLWNFEGDADNFVDEVNDFTIASTGITTRVSGLTTELGQAIELDSGAEILSSGLYPIYTMDGLDVGVSGLGNYQTSQGLIDGLGVSASLNNFELRSVAVTYSDGAPEGVDVSASLGNFDMPTVVVEYVDGVPEGIDVSATLGNFDMPVVAVEYNNGDPEAINITASLGNFELL